jgi:hypothetical protein
MEWHLSINTNKYVVVSFSSKPQPASRNYYIDGVAVSCRDIHVDLGITVSSALSFELHIDNIVSKARQRVGTLFRGILSRNLSTMRLASLPAYVQF